MGNGITYRRIARRWCRCVDVGCDDFQAARENRERVKKHTHDEGYRFIEALVKAWPHKKPLPYWITTGNLPKVGKGENIHQYGIHEIND